MSNSFLKFLPSQTIFFSFCGTKILPFHKPSQHKYSLAFIFCLNHFSSVFTFQSVSPFHSTHTTLHIHQFISHLYLHLQSMEDNREICCWSRRQYGGYGDGDYGDKMLMAGDSDCDGSDGDAWYCPCSLSLSLSVYSDTRQV